MRYMISDHARYKLRERFPDLVVALESLLDDAVKFGGQIGTDYYLLNTKHQMIFPVTIDEETAEHWIKTTLTYDQGMANISLFSTKRSKIFAPTDPDLPKLLDENRKNACAASPDHVEVKVTISDETMAMIKTAAEQFVVDNDYKYPPGKERKSIEDRIRKSVPITRSQFKTYFWTEVGELIYQHNYRNGRNLSGGQ